MQCYGLNYCLWSASPLMWSEKQHSGYCLTFSFQAILRAVCALSASPSFTAVLAPFAWLCPCSLRLQGHGRCTHRDRSPPRTEWPVSQTDTLLQTASKKYSATNIWYGMWQPHAVFEREIKVWFCNSARKYIAVDQNNEQYLFPDVWSVSTVD